ncbi:hypothetical protein SAY86_004842 [Trapa natans]|uniref:Uncharacterized protein n=1 Tax=Trapa natans TaxID=22666 RepID=A0AAN7RJ98_TRANT|nr:hypothetical protein SAY86_004842 [Trapa natans]
MVYPFQHVHMIYIYICIYTIDFQGVLAKKRLNFQRNQFLLTNEIGRKDTHAPFHSKAPLHDMMIHSNKARAWAPFSTGNRSSNNAVVISKQQDVGNGSSKRQKQKTLDARFANLKEQRMRAAALSRPSSNSMTHHRNGGGLGRKQIPPWNRFPK